jgi:hypothetical protein
MEKNQREVILISFFNEKQKYKKLAEYIVQLIQNDPSSPKESLHTILYRKTPRRIEFRGNTGKNASAVTHQKAAAGI